MNEEISPAPVSPSPPPAPVAEKRRSRVGATWVTLAVFVVILLLLVIFILQNSMTVHIHYLGAHGSLGFGVALLIAAIAGSLLTLLIGSVRILQLKLSEKHHEKNP